jgi:hypothetical protein
VALLADTLLVALLAEAFELAFAVTFSEDIRLAPKLVALSDMFEAEVFEELMFDAELLLEDAFSEELLLEDIFPDELFYAGMLELLTVPNMLLRVSLAIILTVILPTLQAASMFIPKWIS